MKIAILGSAPSSLGLAPFGDPAFKIWGCSPGVYPVAPRVDAWFELHRWEPGVVGKPATQKPWFSPEYVQWMARLPCNVWMKEAVPEIPKSAPLPIEDLKAKYGTYFWTSSISIMLACAIDDILEERKVRTEPAEDMISLYGVDMSANEEYGYQRAGCQYFLTLANQLGIGIWVPPESDLLRPMPVYGLCESEWWHIKGTARRRELENRLANATAVYENAKNEMHFLRGCLDDTKYHLDTWAETRDGAGTDAEILAQSPELQAMILARFAPKPEVLYGGPAGGSMAASAPQAVRKARKPAKSKKRRR